MSVSLNKYTQPCDDGYSFRNTTLDRCINLPIKRITIIPYVQLGGKIYYPMFVSSVYLELCDAGGAVQTGMTDILDAGFRELYEESLGLFERSMFNITGGEKCVSYKFNPKNIPNRSFFGLAVFCPLADPSIFDKVNGHIMGMKYLDDVSEFLERGEFQTVKEKYETCFMFWLGLTELYDILKGNETYSSYTLEQISTFEEIVERFPPLFKDHMETDKTSSATVKSANAYLTRRRGRLPLFWEKWRRILRVHFKLDM